MLKKSCYIYHNGYSHNIDTVSVYNMKEFEQCSWDFDAIFVFPGVIKLSFINEKCVSGDADYLKAIFMLYFVLKNFTFCLFFFEVFSTFCPVYFCVNVNCCENVLL